MSLDTNVKRHRKGNLSREALTASVSTDTIKKAMHSREPATLGERIKLVREERHLGSNELTRLIVLPDGTRPSDGYISSLETGRRKDIPGSYVAAIAKVLGVRPEWLLDGRGPRTLESGQFPAVVTAARSDKPNLEHAIGAAKRGRWSDYTVAAARAMSGDQPVSKWISVLDKIEAAIHDALPPELR